MRCACRIAEASSNNSQENDSDQNVTTHLLEFKVYPLTTEKFRPNGGPGATDGTAVG